MLRRFVRFNAVSALGIIVQILILWVLIDVAGLHYAVATGLAVTAAVLHNFVWHHHWTWANRARVRAGTTGRLARFVLGNGAVSLTGNLVLTTALIRGLNMTPLTANVAAIAACGLLNFWLSDRVVFQGRQRGSFLELS